MRKVDLLFPGGKQKALTFSFDDGVTQDGRLMDLFKRYHMKATFNLNSGCFGEKHAPTKEKPIAHNRYEEAEIKERYTGFEIAVHGYQHIRLGSVPSTVQTYELAFDKYHLEKILDQRILGAAYAYGTYNADTLKIMDLLDLEYGRTTVSSHTFLFPEDFRQWHPTCHFLDTSMDELITKFLEKNTKREPFKIFYIWGHSFELDIDDRWEIFEKKLQRLADQEDIWYATNGEIVRYKKCFDQLKYSMDGSKIYNESNQDIWIDVDGKIYRIKAGDAVIAAD